MSPLFQLLLIATGLLACARWIIARRPDARQVFERVAPYSGALGIALLVVAALDLLKHLLPDFGVIALCTWIAGVLLGFFHGFDLLAKWFGSRNPERTLQGQRLRARLAALRVPLGMVGVVLGVWGLL